VSQRPHAPPRGPGHALAAVGAGVVLGVAADPDGVLDLVAADLPRVAEPQPAVDALVLPAVADLLIEDAELVADAVADRRQLEGGQRVEEAGGEPAEATVAEAGLLLVLDQLVVRQPEVGQRRPQRGLDAEGQDVVAELRAEQVLGGQVDDGAVVALEEGAGRPHPPRQIGRAHV